VNDTFTFQADNVGRVTNFFLFLPGSSSNLLANRIEVKVRRKKKEKDVNLKRTK
jgi:hypothetical protein